MVGVPDLTRRILVFGATGQVGRELMKVLPALGTVTAPGRQDADFANPETLRAIVQAHEPHIVINAAAYTAVDRAEGEVALAHAVNAVAPAVLAAEAHRTGACMVHYSTDYVFDGRKPTAYTEDDAPAPLSVYGRTKLEGEQAVRSACPRSFVLRTSWVMASHGSNFLRTMLRLAAEREQLRVVADQVGAPTSAALIAGVTAACLGTMADASAADVRWGTYHLAAAGETTWHGYARHIIARARDLGFPLKAGPGEVLPIATEEYPTPARRPLNSRLDTSRLRATFGVELPDWREGADAVLGQLVPRN